ncbi:MAG: SpoIIIAH-like family protein [Lachnospiraceae bacterium]|nr:SpoIIIAH-like family protein [Lachnospiraceae bacterium]
MKKIFKKNQLIITALALMIAVAGYISFVGDHGKDSEVAQQASADAMDEAYTYDIADDMEIQEEDIFTDTEEHSTEAALETSVENPGEAVLASTATGTMDYAAQMKLNREQVRSKNKEVLNEIISNEALEDSQKQEAVDQLVELTDIAEREAAAEMLLEAKGFTSVVVSITDDSADVVLDMGEVTDAKRAQVEDIVKRKTNIDAANIIITPIESGEVY